MSRKTASQTWVFLFPQFSPVDRFQIPYRHFASSPLRLKSEACFAVLAAEYRHLNQNLPVVCLSSVLWSHNPPDQTKFQTGLFFSLLLFLLVTSAGNPF